MKIILLASLLISSLSYAFEIDPTRFETLPDKAKDVVLEAIVDFPDRRPSVGDQVPDDFSMMMTIEKLNQPLDKVWAAYTTVPPAIVWSGPRVNYAMAIDRDTQKVFYPDEASPRFKERLMFMNYLNFVGKYMVIGLEVTKIDHVKKEIEIAYLEGNASRGKQILKFKASKRGTQINHISLYQSDSWFRDLVVYPFFHRLTTGEHHKKMKRLILEDKKSPL
tara:strand:+ start:5336 stop:5998 length:663 start_codon:yes stop_codon:yes gene_type:complete